MARYGYRPGGAPEISPAQRDRNAAWFAWNERLRTLSGHWADLAFAGRFDEATDYQATVIDPHRAAQPAY